MILNIKKEYVRSINDGTKIHKIIPDKADRWHEGSTIDLATGAMTKKYNCFKQTMCRSTQDIKIEWIINHYRYPHITTRVIVNDNLLDRFKMEDLARNEGFESKEEFFKTYKKNFTGKIIHWTQHKY